MAKRQCQKGFLHEYVAYTQKTEVPEYYGLWVGLSIVCACLERKTFIVTRPIIYPNQYIVLVANSGLCRKSTAIDQGIGIMENIDDPPRILAQKTTTEALIEQLRDAKVPVVKDSASGLVATPVGGAQAILVVDELSTLLNKEAFRSGLVALLTKIWDSSERDFKYHTRSHGTEIIHDPCLSMLGGTTASWLKSCIPEESVGGGFTSRIVFVSADRSDRYDAWPEVGEDVMRQEARLIHDLNCIRKLEGDFDVEPEAKRFFAETYEEFLTTSSFVNDFSLAGYASRRHVILQKTTMAISASESGRMIITAEHYQKAIAILSQTEHRMPTILRTIMATVDGESLQDVLEFIKMEGRVGRSTLTRRFQHRMKVRELDEILLTLETGEGIKTELEADGRTITYTFLGEQV